MTVLLKEAEFSAGGTVKKNLLKPAGSSIVVAGPGPDSTIFLTTHNIGEAKSRVTPEFELF